MNVIKGYINLVVKKALRYQARIKLSQLRNIKYPAADKIANAIYDALNDNLAPEEKKWVERIEETRKILNNLSTEILVTDYGAGNPNINRTEEEMYKGVVSTTTVSSACKSSKPYFWSLVLFNLVRKIKPLTGVELGTCLGISAAYQAAAQKINNTGKFITLEGAQSLSSIAEKNLQQLGLDNAHVVCGRFQDNLDRILNEYKPIDYAFIDGHHDKKATISYFEQFVPYLSKNAIIVFDDISWSNGMRHAWEIIEKSERVKISLNLGTIGICVFDENIGQKYSFKIPMF